MAWLRYTLLAEGSSDEALIPIITWLIAQHWGNVKIAPAFARDLRTDGGGLHARVRAACRNYPCHILFIHRDADSMGRQQRLAEIERALRELATRHVPMVPARMTESWLFSDESAIRFAAGNASGRQPLDLPSRKQWETLANPKAALFEALKKASGLSGRRLASFSPEEARARITPNTDSFAALRGLKAFDAFEKDLINQLRKLDKNALD